MDSCLIYNLENKRDVIIEELITSQQYIPVHKDIIIVVKDQLDYIKACINSIYEHTEDFSLYIWDNASQEPTASFLRSLDAVYHREDQNLGFIIPNNRLAILGNSPYIVLLNSDTVVHKGWQQGLVGWLQNHTDVAITGYGGGKLREDFQGGEIAYGEDADYVCGWSMCFSREIFEKYGLFDEKLQFAYGEDSDFCLRLKEMGKKLYVLHLELVEHFGNKTIASLDGCNFSKCFAANHTYLRKKWFTYRQSVV